jgi:hypothetical protein
MATGEFRALEVWAKGTTPVPSGDMGTWCILAEARELWERSRARGHRDSLKKKN